MRIVFVANTRHLPKDALGFESAGGMFFRLAEYLIDVIAVSAFAVETEHAFSLRAIGGKTHSMEDKLTAAKCRWLAIGGSVKRLDGFSKHVSCSAKPLRLARRQGT
jgi:hypothetical protein